MGEGGWRGYKQVDNGHVGGRITAPETNNQGATRSILGTTTPKDNYPWDMYPLGQLLLCLLPTRTTTPVTNIPIGQLPLLLGQ